ncbi:MAG: hypothetical protein ACREV9_04865 [Burkholderiales bacterium]
MLKILILLLSLILPATAIAERKFPDSAKRGELTSMQYPHVTIDGKRYQLAPGAKVFGKDNRIVLPTMYPTRAPIGYQVDFNGDVSKIWVLTVEEQRNFKKK